mmetsp:Transcript_33695/g.74201  ORF Transcript_33695/g.74201 Transcript_33695/m.74201 type:complete len:678 (+) Transcript_33695:419-2452(+)
MAAKDVTLEVLGSLLLFFLVFGMSATVDIRSIKKQVKNKYAIATGVFLQFVLLPFLGFVVVKALNMSHAMGLTLLVVTSSPGGSYSNWWCSMFNADLALSVTMTAISTLLSTVMLPVNLLLYTSVTYEGDVVASLDWKSLFIAIGVVIGAIGLGLTASAKVHSHRFNRISNMCGNVSGIALVVFSAAISNAGGENLEGEAAPRIWDHNWVFYVGVAAPCVLGLALSNALTSFCKLRKPERVTVSVECCYQNVGIATSVALTMFEGADRAEAMAVPLYYGIVEAVFVGLYCVFAWKIGWTKAPASAKIWEVLLTSYEVIEAEQQELQEIEVSLSDGTFDESEKTSKNGGTIFHYFHMDSICHKLVDELCSKERQCGFGTAKEVDDASYHEHDNAGPVGPKEPSGYNDISLNESLLDRGDEEDEEKGSSLAVAMQQRWRWHRRTRSADDIITKEIFQEAGNPPSSTPCSPGSTLPRPARVHRNKTVATDNPSAASSTLDGKSNVSSRSVLVGTVQTAETQPMAQNDCRSEVALGYISSASSSSLSSTSSDEADHTCQARYLPPSFTVSTPSQTSNAIAPKPVVDPACTMMPECISMDASAPTAFSETEGKSAREEVVVVEEYDEEEVCSSDTTEHHANTSITESSLSSKDDDGIKENVITGLEGGGGDDEKEMPNADSE